MRNIRGMLDNFRTAVGESQEIMAISGTVVGVVLATVIERNSPQPDPETFAITVAQARTSLLSALGLVFTGLSIVLAPLPHPPPFFPHLLTALMSVLHISP